MMKPRSLLGVVALVLLATLVGPACGGDDDQTQTNEVSAGRGTIIASTANPTAAPCRQVSHQLGTACVPAAPQRIVALDSLTVLPTLLNLGAPVVGSTAQYATGTRFPAYIDPAQTAQIEVVGLGTAGGEIDIEKIVVLRPDLIIGWSSQVQPIQAKLEAVAPTVATPFTFYNPDWRSDVRFIADVVGRRAEMESQLTALDAKIAATKAKITATGRPLSSGVLTSTWSAGSTTATNARGLATSCSARASFSRRRRRAPAHRAMPARPRS